MLLAEQKRVYAKKCLEIALSGDLKSAARIRQQAYAISPPGSIGIDWSDWNAIWQKDFQYIKYMNAEDYSDVDNSTKRIESMKAGIFIDYLFDFRDCWGIFQQAKLTNEPFASQALEDFLIKNNWVFESENREIIYTNTKKRNITAKIYLMLHYHVYPKGEYYLGFFPGTPQKTIDARRRWLLTYEQFSKMSGSNIPGFPKTFQTFEKHKKNNSEKYQSWVQQYQELDK